MLTRLGMIDTFAQTANNFRRMWLHEDQVRQVAVECRNPTKPDFSHLRRLEGTSGL
jgi:hypothetical protein